MGNVKGDQLYRKRPLAKTSKPQKAIDSESRIAYNNSSLGLGSLETGMRNSFAALTLLVSVFSAPLFAQKVDFEKQIWPILAQRCHSCHGDEVQQSGLRLDKRQNAMRGSDYGVVIVPYKSAASKLIRRVVNGDGGMQMPPTGELPKEEIDLLRRWIDEGADFRMEVKDEAPPKPVDPKVTSFVSAIRNQDDRTVEKMLAADPALAQARDAANTTPLQHAAAFGSLGTMKLLIAKGADVNAKNRRASTPLHWAIGDEARVRLLLQNGASVNVRQADGRTPLYLVALAANSNGLMKLLLEKGADANLATANGLTPLIAASTRGDVDAMRLLLESKAEVNARNGAGATALMSAATSGNPEAVALLLSKGADAKAVTKKNDTALHAAATAGVERSVKLLLDAGTPVNIQDDRGYSALMLAAASEAMPAEVVKMLLAKGADAGAKTVEGYTPQSLAAQRGDTEVARVLGVSQEVRRKGGVAAAANPRVRPVTEAVSQALALLEKQSHNFIRIGGCNSCHSQDLPSSALALARAQGIPTPREIAQIPEALNGETPERIMDFGAVSVSSIGWEMFDRGANRTPRDAYTDATVYYTKLMQTPEGYWRGPDGRRPPMSSGDFQTTALGIFTLRNFGPPAGQAEISKALARAAVWLEKSNPVTIQERAFHLMGLRWAGAGVEAIDRSARALAAMQRADGGWGQHATMGTDAYASGQALYALRTAGNMAPNDSVYQKGRQYLLSTQGGDGAWHVKTRSIWLQPYFESGFPYGQDQFISSAGTAWAVMALTAGQEPLRSSLR